eukprot:5971186-Prymnesium_polylepis.2
MLPLRSSRESSGRALSLVTTVRRGRQGGAPNIVQGCKRVPCAKAAQLCVRGRCVPWAILCSLARSAAGTTLGLVQQRSYLQRQAGEVEAKRADVHEAAHIQLAEEPFAFRLHQQLGPAATATVDGRAVGASRTPSLRVAFEDGHADLALHSPARGSHARDVRHGRQRVRPRVEQPHCRVDIPIRIISGAIVGEVEANLVPLHTTGPQHCKRVGRSTVQPYSDTARRNAALRAENLAVSARISGCDGMLKKYAGTVETVHGRSGS